MSEQTPLEPSERPELQIASPNPSTSSRPGTSAIAEILLACAWLLLPAIQYYGTYQRTGLQLEGIAPTPALTTLDLTVGYWVLFAATLLLLFVRFTRAHRPSPQSESAMPATPPEVWP